MKYILIEQADGGDPWQLRIFGTQAERIRATVEAICGSPNEDSEAVRAELRTLESDKILHFEGDPSLQWIDAEVPLIEEIMDAERREQTRLIDQRDQLQSRLTQIEEQNWVMREALEAVLPYFEGEHHPNHPDVVRIRKALDAEVERLVREQL